MIDPGRLDRLFEEALGRPPDERASFAAARCGGDADLERELLELLRAHDESGDFLNDPAGWLAELSAPPTPSPFNPVSGVSPPWLDRSVSHYEILEPIGAGGMGLVFKARDTKLDRRVTLKFLHPHLSTLPNVTARFVQEARAASALDHPNICTIHEIGEASDGQLFIAMAYYAGETLKDRLARGPLPRAEALGVARAVAAGLEAAHEAGIVHRDLKPGNVMLTERGEVKILDFGVAKLEGAAQITASGLRLGTVAYASPEQGRGDPVDHRSDIWSLGVVLAEMLTGARPFAGDSDAAVVHAIVHAEPTLAGDVPPDVEGVIRTALAKEPGARFPTMTAFRVALEGLAEGRAPKPRPARPAAWGRGRLWRTTAGLALAALAAIVALLTLRPDRAGPPAAQADPPRLVVLPFDNLGPAEDQYFADGMTDEVITRLARVSGLAVLARQSAMRYRGTDKSPGEIGSELGVDYLLEGTLSWERPGSGPAHVRVRPQLIRVSDGTHLWTEVYEADLRGVLAVQSRIAEQVATALGVALLESDRSALAQRRTGDLEAYDRYLRGNHYLLQRDRESTIRAIEEYGAAAKIDPDFADAQARVAYAYALFADHGWSHPALSTDEMLGRGFEAADRALELNPRSADAWMARAYLLVFRNPDTYAGVDEAFAQAMRYDPNNAEAQHQYASMIGRLGLTPEVEARFHRALALEPNHAIAILNLGFFYLIERRYDDALRYADSAVAINPGLYHSYEHRAQVRSHAGLHSGARADAEAAIAGSDSALGLPSLALVSARAGDSTTARFAVERALAGELGLHNEGRIWLIGALIALGETTRALDLLAPERERLGLVYLRHLTRLPDFDPVRKNPRFRAIVGAPE